MNSLLFLSQLRNTLLLQYSGRCFDAEQSECECITSPADLTYPQVSFSQPKAKVPFPPLITHFFSSLKDVHLVLSSPSLQTSPLSLLSRQLWAQTLRLQDASDRFKTTQNLFEDIVIAMMDGKARITVRNVGETIPAEELPLLFERFHKSDKSRSEDKDGYGLGLYIVKTILQQHKEEINVTSENGVTTFTFSLRVE